LASVVYAFKLDGTDTRLFSRWVINISYNMGAACGAGNAYPS